MPSFPAIAVWLTFLYELVIASRSFQRSGRSPIVILIAAGYYVMLAEVARHRPYTPLIVPGIALLVASAVLVTWAAHTIRNMFFSYIGNRDTPQFVCDQGPYAYIRNPFYAGYLLSHAAVVAMFPNWITAATFAGMFALFWFMAAFEERKFESSPVIEQYRAYRARTGRFIPRIRR